MTLRRFDFEFDNSSRLGSTIISTATGIGDRVGDDIPCTASIEVIASPRNREGVPASCPAVAVTSPDQGLVGHGDHNDSDREWPLCPLCRSVDRPITE